MVPAESLIRLSHQNWIVLKFPRIRLSFSEDKVSIEIGKEKLWITEYDAVNMILKLASPQAEDKIKTNNKNPCWPSSWCSFLWSPGPHSEERRWQLRKLLPGPISSPLNQKKRSRIFILVGMSVASEVCYINDMVKISGGRISTGKH